MAFIKTLVNEQPKRRSKSRETVKRVPETYSEYKRRKAADKFEKVEMQLKNILDKLNDFKAETETPSERDLEFVFKPKVRKAKKPSLEPSHETFKVHKKPVIKPEFCTMDYEKFEISNQNGDPYGHVKYFEQLEGMVNLQEDNTNKHEFEVFLKKIKNDDYEDEIKQEKKRG